MCYDTKIIHTFYNGKLHQFTFLQEGMATKVYLTQEELHFEADGEWKFYSDLNLDPLSYF